MKVMSWVRKGGLVPFLMSAPGIALAQGLSGVQPFQGTAQGGLIQAITTIVNILLILAGIIASLYLLYGGVQYITAAGDEDKAGTAKNTILYALIGLIVIGLSAAVVNFVIGAIRAA